MVHPVPYPPLDNSHPPPQARRLSKLLVSVTVQGSIGPFQVVMLPENTVGDLIKAVLDVYEKQKRRPLLSDNHPSCFQLHYSPFSLQSLEVEEEVINLGSRNFYLCKKTDTNYCGRTCLAQPKKLDKFPFPLAKLMDFLL